MSSSQLRVNLCLLCVHIYVGVNVYAIHMYIYAHM
jgi:hypothetical protein